MSNIHELGAAISEYACEASQVSLSNWLKETALVDNEREETGEAEEKETVHLMTLHSAKGLEFEKVYIVGVEDGLIPHTNSMDDSSKLEEERRLFYVGMTRAQKSLVLVAAARRRVLNSWVSYPISRFVHEIPKSYLNTEAHDVGEDERLRFSFEEGDLVYHNQYKAGRVIEKEEDISGFCQVTVDFKFYGLRKVDARKITKIRVHKGRNVSQFDHS